MASPPLTLSLASTTVRRAAARAEAESKTEWTRVRGRIRMGRGIGRRPRPAVGHRGRRRRDGSQLVSGKPGAAQLVRRDKSVQAVSLDHLVPPVSMWTPRLPSKTVRLRHPHSVPFWF